MEIQEDQKIDGEDSFKFNQTIILETEQAIKLSES